MIKKEIAIVVFIFFNNSMNFETIEINNAEVIPVLFKVRLSELEASSLEAVVIACPPNDWPSPPQAFFSAGTGCIGNGVDDAGNLQEERLL
ncbi:hypothetical protein CEXT_584951 [Caerostris extrusa]|uniref:Uncharacterized protein n=1 Tax=Caerostris extrusa TaxID=172846 RepID=A0AAV4PAD6_CAEEX|nr:hypothetical protein CEXT_584951 [Caerostris extrusa]